MYLLLPHIVSINCNSVLNLTLTSASKEWFQEALSFHVEHILNPVLCHFNRLVNRLYRSFHLINFIQLVMVTGS